MRIASLVPSATETLFALGLGDDVVAVTHECDYPPAARELPNLTRSVIPDGLPAAEIVGQKINPQAQIIWGCSVDDELEHTVRVLLVITGVKSKSLLGKEVYTGPVKTSAEVDEVR